MWRLCVNLAHATFQRPSRYLRATTRHLCWRRRTVDTRSSGCSVCRSQSHILTADHPAGLLLHCGIEAVSVEPSYTLLQWLTPPDSCCIVGLMLYQSISCTLSKGLLHCGIDVVISRTLSHTAVSVLVQLLHWNGQSLIENNTIIAGVQKTALVWLTLFSAHDSTVGAVAFARLGSVGSIHKVYSSLVNMDVGGLNMLIWF